MEVERYREIFDEIYDEYNRREYVSPDPLQFLYDYEDPRDREVVGLIASSLAYGRVESILASIRKVLAPLGDSPADAVRSTSRDELGVMTKGFVHRFTRGEHMRDFLWGIGRALCEHGSLEALFVSSPSEMFWARMDSFVSRLLEYAETGDSFLLPRPSRGSACKRLVLYFRWMIRHDDVDPGGWDCVDRSELAMPLDTHMFNIAHTLGFTSRKSADARAVAEATRGFLRVRPDDPVRYDFALTRYGIRNEMSVTDLFKKCGIVAQD